MVVAREPLRPARLTCIYTVFLPYLTLSSISSVRNIHSSWHPHIIAFICINHSAVIYAHILNRGYTLFTFLLKRDSSYNNNPKSLEL